MGKGGGYEIDFTHVTDGAHQGHETNLTFWGTTWLVSYVAVPHWLTVVTMDTESLLRHTHHIIV